MKIGESGKFQVQDVVKNVLVTGFMEGGAMKEHPFIFCDKAGYDHRVLIQVGVVKGEVLVIADAVTDMQISWRRLAEGKLGCPLRDLTDKKYVVVESVDGDLDVAVRRAVEIVKQRILDARSVDD